MNIAKRSLLAFGLTAVLAACGPNTRIEKSWVDPNPSARMKDFKRILVVSFTDTETSRRVIETEIAKAIGPRAVPSFNYPGLSTPTRDGNLVRRTIMTDGFDAAVISRLVDKEKEQTWVPGMMMPMGMGMGMGPWGMGGMGGMWGAGWGMGMGMGMGGHMVQDKIYYYETNVYDLSLDRLLWSGITSTMNPTRIERKVRDITAAVTKQMRRDGFID
jgi:hypothetical protein